MVTAGAAYYDASGKAMGHEATGGESAREVAQPVRSLPQSVMAPQQALASAIGNRAMGRLLARTANSRVLARALCDPPAHCPADFCQPENRVIAEIERSQMAPVLLAGIAAAVSTRVVGVWSDYIFGGTPPQNLTTQFGRDFETSATTAATTAFLRRSVVNALRASPPTFPPGTSTVRLPLRTLIPTAVAAVDDPTSRNQMNFNVIGEIPGNLAGGIGKNEAACRNGAQPSPFDDERRADGVVVVVTDGAGNLTVDAVIDYTVRDTVDLCPGDCGAPREQLATVTMSQWEATGISGDVPFTVQWSTAMPTATLSVPAPTPSPPTPAPTHLHTVPAHMLFDFSSDRLKPGAAAVIRAELGSAPGNADPHLPVIVRGHTDSIPGPDADFNQRLSERRAAAVGALLASEFPALRGRIQTIGMADTQPVAPNTIDGHDNPAGRALNRRVDIELQEVVPGAGP